VNHSNNSICKQTRGTSVELLAPRRSEENEDRAAGAGPARLDTPAGLRALRRALSDSSPKVRLTVALTLLESSESDALEQLVADAPKERTRGDVEAPALTALWSWACKSRDDDESGVNG
jgi:hypothetical protein